MSRFGKEMKKARFEKDLTQPDLERLTGIAFRHLSAIERGAVHPRWPTVVKIAMALEMHLDDVAWQTHREAEDAAQETPHASA